METKRILTFLKGIAAHNNREWYQANKKEYEACRKSFADDIARLIPAIAEFDDEIAGVDVKDTIFRFNRDIRFSPDKSPYKRHFGAYINAHGKKSLYGGYYIHVQPGQCLLSAGAYWLPTNILTSCRNEIMSRIDEWRRSVENPQFRALYGGVGEGAWAEDEVAPKGFGISLLKTAPKGFPKDYPYVQYLRLKDYACWTKVSDDFFSQTDWIPRAVEAFRVAKPMMDIVNSVIADYE